MKLKARHKRRLRVGLKALLVLLSLAAVSLSGANAAARAFAEQQKPQKPHASEAASMAVDPLSGEAGGGEMATGSRPITEQTAVFSVPVFVKIIEDDGHGKNGLVALVFIETSVSRDVIVSDPLGSTSLVSPHLGRQFTLVGAKPSGTS